MAKIRNYESDEYNMIRLSNIVGLSNNVYREFSEKKVVINIESVEDKLSLIISTTILGSEIGITIIRGNNVLMINKDQIFEDGKMTEVGLNLLAELLVPLKELMEDNHINSVLELKGDKIETIYNKSNRVVMTNRFGMVRELSMISEAEIQACVKQIQSFNINTIEEEYDIFVNDFVNIVRALGESSIDVKKHEDRKFSRNINGFVGAGTACVGNIKSGRDKKACLTSNLYDRGANVISSGYGYQMQLPEKYENEAFQDAIGDIKLAIKDKLEDCVNEKLKESRHYTYDNYNKMLSNLNEKYPVTKALLQRIIKLERRDNLDNNVLKAYYSDKFYGRLRDAIYTTARMEGMKGRDVYKLAVEVCFLNRKGNYYNSKDINSHVPDVNKALSIMDRIFGDIAVYEYNDGHLEVPLRVLDKPDDFEDGKVYDLLDGATDNLELCVEGDYTGKAAVVEGELKAIYDPYDNINYEYVAIPLYCFFDPKTGELSDNKKACVSNIKALNNSKAIKIKKSRIAVMVEEDKIKVVSVTAIPNKANKLVSTNIFDNLALEKVELMAIDKTGIPAEDRETSISYMNYVLLAKFR